jgi:ech hydrogenase subunit F
MFPTIMKNLFSPPATRRYPWEKLREPSPKARGKLYFDTSKCDFCGDCARACPADAIHVDPENKQIRYNPFKCIYCATCLEFCLQHAITMDKYYVPPAGQKSEELHKVEVVEA